MPHDRRETQAGATERENRARARRFLDWVHDELGGDLVVVGEPHNRQLGWAALPAGSSPAERIARACEAHTLAAPILAFVIEALEVPSCRLCGCTAPFAGALCDVCDEFGPLGLGRGYAAGRTVTHLVTSIGTVLCTGQPAGNVYAEPPLPYACMRCARERQRLAAAPRSVPRRAA